MNTNNNFAATLKQVRKVRGMTMREFAAEVGIALSSLAEYEAGRRLPRGDTVKLITERLHMSPALLISASPSGDLTLHSCLEYISRYIQSMHPNTSASANHALALFLLASNTSSWSAMPRPLRTHPLISATFSMKPILLPPMVCWPKNFAMAFGLSPLFSPPSPMTGLLR